MALSAEALVEVEEIKTCKAGHDISDPANLVWYESGRDRKIRPRCKTCKQESVRRSHAKFQRPAAPGRSMIMPRLTRTGQAVARADDAYATIRIWRGLPLAMRARVAGVIMNERLDPVVRRTVERAADGRIWAAATPDACARMFVENLLSSTVDSRSSLLGVDALMGLIWGY